MARNGDLALGMIASLATHAKVAWLATVQVIMHVTYYTVGLPIEPSPAHSSTFSGQAVPVVTLPCSTSDVA